MQKCTDGGSCKTYHTCGRGEPHRGLADHSEVEKCGLSYIECIQQHYRHECAHDFTSGPWVEMENGGTASCACGLTSFDHDMWHAP